MKKGIICAGNWIIDKVKMIDRWPEVGSLCNITSQIRSTGGGPANVGFDLAAMDPNLPLFAAGMIGCDEDGDFVLSEIAKRKMDSTAMIRSKDQPTSFTDVMSGCGKRTFFCCRGAGAAYDVDDIAAIKADAKFFYLAYLLLLDKLDSADSEYGTRAARALKLMQERGLETIVDFVSDAPEKFRRIVTPSLPYIDYLIVNEIESACCSGIELRRADGTMNFAALPQNIDYLLSQGVKKAVVIHFPEGAAGKMRGGEFIYRPSCDITKEEFVGSTGAGDAFAAGVIYGLHENWPLEKAMELGSASSNFNLRSATATGGAVSLARMVEFLKTCAYTPIPKEFQK